MSIQVAWFDTYDSMRCSDKDVPSVQTTGVTTTVLAVNLYCLLIINLVTALLLCGTHDGCGEGHTPHHKD